MGLKMNTVAVKSQLSDMNRNLDTMVTRANLLQSRIRMFTETQALLVAATYDSIREYYTSVHLPLLRGLICYAEELKEANENYSRQIDSWLDADYVDEDGLQEDLETIIRCRDRLNNIEEWGPATYALDHTLEQMQWKIEEKLERIEMFLSATAGIYAGMDNFRDTVCNSILSTNDVLYNSDNNTFDLSKLNYQHIMKLKYKTDSYEKESLIKESCADVLYANYGFSENEALLLKRVYDLCKKNYIGKNFNHHYFSHMAALCINYNGVAFRWNFTGDIPSTQESIKYFQSIGLSDSEIKTLFISINVQHGYESADSLNQYGIPIDSIDINKKNHDTYISKAKTGYYKDFAHELVALAIFNNKSLEKTGLNLVTNNQVDLLASIKGDVYSGRISKDDIFSDLDAINVQNRLLSGDDLYTTYMEYNREIVDGKTNRGVEFLSNYGDGNIDKGKADVRADLESWSLGSDYISGAFPENIQDAVRISSLPLIPFADDINNNSYKNIEEISEKQEERKKRINSSINDFMNELDLILEK